MLLVCPQVLSWRDMAPRTVGGVPKVHAGSWEHFFKKLQNLCRPLPRRCGCGTGVSTHCHPLRLCWQSCVTRCGDVCGVRSGGRVPCVAAGAVLESAVF